MKILKDLLANNGIVFDISNSELDEEEYKFFAGLGYIEQGSKDGRICIRLTERGKAFAMLALDPFVKGPADLLYWLVNPQLPTPLLPFLQENGFVVEGALNEKRIEEVVYAWRDLMDQQLAQQELIYDLLEAVNGTNKT